MIIKNKSKQQIGQFVAESYKTAAVFSKYGIDFCCKGNRTIEEVCAEKDIDRSILLYELQTALNSNNSETIDFKSWPLDLLIDYIEKKHHRYVETQSKVLLQFISKLCKVHGEKNPNLLIINEQFSAAAGELAAHMKKEELILFPFIKKLVKAYNTKTTLDQPSFGTAKNPIKIMEEEHNIEGERFRLISELTKNYTLPKDGCNTFKVTYEMLADFEADLHLHIHLENNILFPETLKLERLVISH